MGSYNGHNAQTGYSYRNNYKCSGSYYLNNFYRTTEKEKVNEK